MSKKSLMVASLLWGLAGTALAVEPLLLQRPDEAVDLKDRQGRFLAWATGPETNYLMITPPGDGKPHPQSPLVLTCKNQSRNVTTPAEWKDLRSDIRKRMTDWLGKFPPGDLPLDAKVENESDKGDYTVRLVTVAFDKTLRGRIGLVVPKGLPKPAPAIVLFGGWGSNIEDLTEGVYTRATAIHVARHGFVVAVLDNWIKQFGESSELATLGAAVHMAGRAVDYLQTQKDLVAPDRIGVYGHTYGGDLSIFAGALEERFAAVAISCTQNIPIPREYHYPPWTGRGSGLGCVNRVAPDMYGSRRPVDVEDLPFSTQEVFALVAPRPLLLVAVAPGQGEENMRDCIENVWKLYGRAGAIEIIQDKWKENQSVTARNYMAGFFLRGMCGTYPGKVPEATVKEILDGLSSQDAARQLTAARQAAWWQCEPAIPALAKLLAGQDEVLRRAAAKALERAGAMDELAGFLTDPDPVIRLTVCEAMHTCGTKQSFKALAKNESDKDKWVRECKAQTIQVRVTD